MRTSHWLVSAMGAVALGILAMPAQAAPMGAVTGNTTAAQEGQSTVDQVHSRCYWHRGHWHCPRHDYYYYQPYYYYGYRHHRHHHHHHHRHHRW